GRIARSGGHGPQRSDEGSAFAIGKRAIHECATRTDGASRELQQKILFELGAASLAAISHLTGADADAVYPSVFPLVAATADAGNDLSRKLLLDAAKTLAQFVEHVQTDLHLNAAAFVLAKTGGMIGRSNFFDEALDKELRQVEPRANLQILR